MTEALLELLPDSPVYHVGMYRNPGSNIPVQYYNRLPKGHPSDVALILDPVIASCKGARHRPTTLKKLSTCFTVCYAYHLGARTTYTSSTSTNCAVIQ